MAMCTICWFALHETLFIDVISICFFIEMVKLLEHKHFKISLYVLIYLNFLFVYFNTNSLKLWTTHIVLNIVLDPITGDVMNIVTLQLTRRVWRYQRGNQNPYIEEEQTTQWPKEKVQQDKQLSIKHTYKTKDRVTRTPLKTGGELR